MDGGHTHRKWGGGIMEGGHTHRKGGGGGEGGNGRWAHTQKRGGEGGGMEGGLTQRGGGGGMEGGKGQEQAAGGEQLSIGMYLLGGRDGTHREGMGERADAQKWIKQRG